MLTRDEGVNIFPVPIDRRLCRGCAINWNESHSLKRFLTGLCLTVAVPQPALATNSFYLGGGVGSTEFDEVVYAGEGSLLAFDLGVRFITDTGLYERPSLEFGVMFDFTFSTEASRGDDDDLDLSVTTFYLRHDQQLGEKVWGFGQIGFSSIEVEDTSQSCFLTSCTTITNYRNKDSGMSWGLGLNIRTGLNYLVSIAYFDFFQSNIDATTWRITLRREGIW